MRVITPEPVRTGFAFVLVLLALLGMGIIIVLPLITVFSEAFSKGTQKVLSALANPDAQAAIRLTLMVSATAVPLGALFGLAAAWTVTKFDFPGKTVLLTLIDLPFSISPVVSGLVWVLLFGAHGWFGAWLYEHNIKILFAFPGLVLATLIVSLPFVARELIPLMLEQGTDEEAAAVTLGAPAWLVFFKVTLPNIKWALLYGILLATARAMGEFGAVSVVSGHIRGLTNTLPLHVEVLYNEYDYVGAFAAASVLAGLALITLLIKTLFETFFADELAAQRRH